MEIGIIICGLNGAGKSTLGKALADKLSFYFIDNEDLYFSKADVLYPYNFPRTKKEAEYLLMSKIKTHSNFIFASVSCNFTEDICYFFKYAIFIDAPKLIRLR